MPETSESQLARDLAFTATAPVGTPPVTEAEVAEADGLPAAEHTPTREEAKAMFAENPGLSAVMTDEGNVTRDQC